MLAISHAYQCATTKEVKEGREGDSAVREQSQRFHCFCRVGGTSSATCIISPDLHPLASVRAVLERERRRASVQIPIFSENGEGSITAGGKYK